MIKQTKLVKRLLPVLLSACLLCVSSFVFSQGKIPPFRIMQANGRIFKAEELPIGKPVVIIYFSPECDHCDKLMKDLFKQKTGFDKASIAMITYLPVEKLSSFYRAYDLDKYPNIYAGTEGTSFFVRNYYKIRDMPFVVLYNKNGDCVKSYSREVDLRDVGSRLSQLK